ncbi:MAG: PAS domain-containing protein [Sulfuricurvum sp.]|uniref:PAS domain-containing protein n=1 Tax=Sulfuricurvum sp. TaxID=2025608 RepID=UPI00261E46FF|nr:PAS domain-containing protein [Sulfuricurvum sp.]MDD2828709.1 PAS domain-containing protein [Sulfuricurvum sp.]MDD4949287.1 PAS domain-containing protein [Sulfuricurvum sp.]
MVKPEEKTQNNRLMFMDDGEVMYDELYLLSETDEKGIITYANDSFYNVAGWGKDDLVGQPHNVIRHPDMPRAAFRSLWHDIQEKGFWTGMVKNARKGGGFYWVYATVMRSIDKNGNIKYASIRIKPTRDEIKKAEALYANWE